MGYPTTAPADVEQELSTLKGIFQGDFLDVTSQVASEAAIAGDGVGAFVGAAADGAVELDVAGGPVAWIVGAVVLALLMAGPWIIRILAWLLSHVPVVGGWIAGRLNGFATDWQNTIWWWLGSTLDSLWHFVRGLWLTLWSLPHVIGQGISASIGWLSWLQNVLIPSYYQDSINHADQLHYQEEQAVLQAEQQATAQQQYALQIAQQDAQGALGDAEQYARHLSDLNAQAIAAATATAAQQLQQQAQAEALAVTHAEELGQQYTDQQVGKATVAVENQLDATSKSLEQQIASLATGLGLTIGTLATTVTGEITQLGATTATDLQGLQKQVDNMAKTCVDPMCQTQGRDADQLLNLLKIGGIAALFAFLAAAIKEPKPTAAVSVAVLDPVIHVAGGLLDDAISFVG